MDVYVHVAYQAIVYGERFLLSVTLATTVQLALHISNKRNTVIYRSIIHRLQYGALLQLSATDKAFH